MELLNDAIQAYLEKHCEPETELLKFINRETHLKVAMPRMLSGHYQGRVLSMLSKLLSPKRILEIGTYTGYATLCLAEGLPADGIIHTIDVNEELEEAVGKYFNQSQFAPQIKYHIGKAAEVIPSLDETYNLIFIDADKKNNATYYDLVFDRLQRGGMIIVDNVLWSGKIVSGQTDSDSASISSFNEKITADSRVEKLILPVRDGLFVIRKL